MPLDDRLRLIPSCNGAARPEPTPILASTRLSRIANDCYHSASNQHHRQPSHEMIPVRNSYMLSENLPNVVLVTYPDADTDRSSSIMRPSLAWRIASSYLSRAPRPINRSQRRMRRPVVSILVTGGQIRMASRARDGTRTHETSLRELV